MGIFYRQTTNALEPSNGEYTDIAFYRDGRLKVADENGDWQDPVRISANEPYIWNFTTSDWVTNTNTSIVNLAYMATIKENTHMRGSYSVVSGLFQTLSATSFRHTTPQYSKNAVGDITIYSATRFNGIAYIDRVYPQILPPKVYYVPVWCGTRAEYATMDSHDPTTIYLFTD